VFYHVGLHAYLNTTAKQIKLRTTDLRADLNSVKSTKNQILISLMATMKMQHTVTVFSFLFHSVVIQRQQPSGT